MKKLAIATVLTALSMVSEAAGQERIFVRRYSDQVAVRPRPEANERLLYYFDAIAALQQGGRLEQGSSAYTEMLLSAGGRLSIKGLSHCIVEQLDAAGDVLRFPLMSHLEVVSGERPMTIELPGDIRCELDMGASAEIVREAGRLRIRNLSGYPVKVTGRMALDRGPATESTRSIVLRRGEEVRMPLFYLDEPHDGAKADPWRNPAGSQMVVRHDGDLGYGATLEPLRVWSNSEDGSRITVGGVETRLAPGQVLVLRNARREPLPPVRGSVPVKSPEGPPRSAPGKAPSSDLRDTGGAPDLDAPATTPERDAPGEAGGDTPEDTNDDSNADTTEERPS